MEHREHNIKLNVSKTQFRGVDAAKPKKFERRVDMMKTGKKRERKKETDLDLNFTPFARLVADAAVTPALDEIARASTASDFEVGG